MATIQYLRLDPDYDPVFVPAAALTDLEAVRQAIQTRLELFRGEWWENIDEGTPMFQLVLGAPGSPRSIAVMEAALTARIKGTPYVTAVTSIQSTFDRKTRKYSYSATAETSFGTVAISNASVTEVIQ